MHYSLFRIFLLVLGFAVSAWLGWTVFGALRSGRANAGGVLYKRETDPLYFWAAVGAQGFIALIMAAVVLAALFGHL